MSQVIIVSNRLPVSVKKEKGKLNFYPSLGGLATGLSSYANDKNNVWIGWPGIASDGLTDREKQEIVHELGKHNCSPVWLSQKQIDEFYNGYSNAVLWPIFHNLRHRRKTAAETKPWWRAYRRVNEQYAQAVLNMAESGSRVWVHDYQLMLVPELLRAERPDITSGFFLHIPFPDVKTLDSLAESKKLLKGILGADVVGFHTPGYVSNFLDNSEAAGLGVADNNIFLLDDRPVRVADFPMGIDYQKYASSGKSKAVRAATRKYNRRYKRRKVIAAVDRLDPSKGLAERLKAYRLFLEKYPKLRGKVIFSMVAAPSRTDIPAYQKLSAQLNELVTTINETYGTPKWQPIDYINESIPFEDVTALFRRADVAFIAPIKDGMNLAAKEFVASAHKNGALILSETAGASEELQDALIVNPKHPEAMVDALYEALTMRRRELRRRLTRMRQQLSSYTVQDWAHDFVETLQQPVPGTKGTRTLRESLQSRLLFDYSSSRRRLLLLDYDGSLVGFSEDYRNAKPPKALISLLEKLCADPANDLVMISGRSATDLEKWFGQLPISLVAEHGASIKKAGNKSWQTIERPDTTWKRTLLPILEKYAALAPGARIEIKPHTLVWHYRAVPPYYAQKYGVIIKRVLRPYLKRYGLQLMQGNKVLEIKNPQISKGNAAGRWLKRDYDFVLGLGDDLTDEELFAAMSPSSYSIKVGRGRTAARFRLPHHRDVNKLLKLLSKTA